MLRPHCLSSNRQGDRRARRVESNNRERRRMHELNHAFQVNLILVSMVMFIIILITMLMLLGTLSQRIEKEKARRLFS